MSRWNAYGRLDSRLLEDGDAKFIGVDMTRDRALLGPGMMAGTLNKRLRNGAAATRPGNLQPGDFAAPFTNTFIGSGIYSNPNGDEVMLVAEANATYDFGGAIGVRAFVWALQSGKDPSRVALAAGQTLSGSSGVNFVQAFDKVILLRRPSAGTTPLEWDGTAGHTFDAVVKPAGAFAIIPSAWNGEPFQSRVLYYAAFYSAPPWNSQFIQSDILEYAGYDPDLCTFNVNAGESDYMIRIWPYFQRSVVVFKRRTIHQVANFADDPTFMTQRQLSKVHGLCATNCVVESGPDLLFLDEPGGIYKLNQVIQDRIATEPYPVSDDIQPLIDRINWPQAQQWACAATLKEYAYFALPLNIYPGGTGNDAVAVYNTVTSKWESTPDFVTDAAFRIHALHVTKFRDGRAVFALDYTAKKIYALYQGGASAKDEVNDTVVPIIDAMETRGYTCGDPAGFKRYSRAVLALRTVNPLVKVSALSDGYNESKDLTPTPLTKDRLKFYPHGHDDFNAATDDPAEPKREDYSTAGLLDNFVGEDFELIPVGPVSQIPPSTDSVTGPLQESREPFSVRVNARWLSLRIQNENGVCEVLATGIEATASTMETKTAA